MALKVLMLRKKLNDARKALDALRAKDAEFTTRETELEKSIEEAQSDEERTAVEEEIETFTTEKATHETEKGDLERQIEELESDLAAEEAAQATDPENKPEEREEKPDMHTRSRIFAGMTSEQRTAMFARDDVKAWIGEIRAHIKEKRELTNVGLTIPEVFLGVLRQNIEDFSKLLKYVTAKPVSGTGREVIMGGVMEAIWTECCANLNEMSIGFNDVEIDCYKIGGYFKICNSTLEDSDIDLASEVLTAIGQGIGYALDKAILYGRNSASHSKMPLGVVSRLVQTSQPANYPATARPWVDLHSTNILTIANNVTGTALFQMLLLDSGVISDKYATRESVWVINKTTYNFMKAQGLSINAAGAIVSGMEGSMPVVGGKVETLDFVPNYVIIGGHFENYLLAERAGKKFAQSEHAFFLQDQTAFKGTARYDGQPVIPEAFVVIGINGVTPDADMDFAADNANTPDVVILNASAVSVQATNTANLKATVLAAGIPIDANITWSSSDTTKATVSDGKVTGVAAGSAVITATAGSASAVCNVTVTS